MCQYFSSDKSSIINCSSFRSGQALIRDPDCTTLPTSSKIVVPDIVKPQTPSIPSAMKGAGGPPRSPKDKVTFAEFTDVCEGQSCNKDFSKIFWDAFLNTIYYWLGTCINCQLQ